MWAGKTEVGRERGSVVYITISRMYVARLGRDQAGTRQRHSALTRVAGRVWLCSGGGGAAKARYPLTVICLAYAFD